MAKLPTHPVVTLVGWVHVHTWQESHGNGTQETYQRDPNHTGWPQWGERRVELLVLSRERDSRVSHVRIESDKDYLMAQEIKSNPDRYERLEYQSTSPCSTAGADHFKDKQTDQLWRVTSVAGHGEWAFKIKEDDLIIKEW